MDYSVDAIAGKLILVIAVISVAIAGAGYFVYVWLTGNPDASIAVFSIMGVTQGHAAVADTIPFATGVLAAMGLNIAKVLLMKRAVAGAMKRDAITAKLYLQGQYFLRLVLTAAVLIAAGVLHGMRPDNVINPHYLNFMGTFFGIFSFPLAMYSMRLFIKDEPKDIVLEESEEKSTVQSAIDELNAIGAEEKKGEAENFSEADATDENKAG